MKFKQIGEMKQIRSDPMQFYPIAKLAGQTYRKLLAEMLVLEIQSKFSEDKQFELVGDKERIKFTASACDMGKESQVQLSGNVVVSEYDLSKKSDQPSYIYKSSRAILELQNGANAPVIQLTIEDTPEWTRPDGTRGWSSQHIVKNLAPPQTILQKTGQDPLLAVAAMPSLLKTPSNDLIKLQESLKNEIETDLNDINVEINSRLIFGIGCISLILIGTGLGILLKGGHLLTAFGVSAVPAGVLIVFIIMGRNLADKFHVTGIFLMWSSLIVLAILAIVIYRKLLKT